MDMCGWFGRIWLDFDVLFCRSGSVLWIWVVDMGRAGSSWVDMCGSGLIWVDPCWYVCIWVCMGVSVRIYVELGGWFGRIWSDLDGFLVDLYLCCVSDVDMGRAGSICVDVCGSVLICADPG